MKLLLPALAPSWRFFDSVGPSPRIEYALSQSPQDIPDWREFRPRPVVMGWREMLWRLFWNPGRNESLFLTSCAERLLEDPTEHGVKDIWARIGADSKNMPYLQFRIVLISRGEAGLVREVAYVSAVRRRA